MNLGSSSDKLQEVTWEKDQGREDLEDNGKVSFLKRKDLWLDSGFIATLNRLVSLSESIDLIVREWEVEADNSEDLIEPRMRYHLLEDEVKVQDLVSEIEMMARVRNRAQHSDIDYFDDKDDFNAKNAKGIAAYFADRKRGLEQEEGIKSLEDLDEKIIDKKRELNERIKERLNELSDSVEEELRKFNQERSEENLEITTGRRLYCCPECSQLLEDNERFGDETKCNCGEVIGTIREGNNFSIRELNEGVQKIITDNIDLEFASERLFEKMDGFRAESGVHILGSTGIKHEIDTLAENRSSGYRVLCECKTTDITLNELMKFNQKCEDIGSVYRIFIATGEVSGKKEKRFARKHNILLVENFWSDTESLEQRIDRYLADEAFKPQET